MNKPRNFRRKTDDDDSDDEATTTKITGIQKQQGTTNALLTNKPAATAAPKSKGPVVSFGGDEDEDGGEDIKLKKSKASKMFKKIRQAPTALPVSAEVQEQVKPSAYVSLGGNYSGDSLEALRKQQNFAVASASSTAAADGIVEGLELGGEDAENLEVLAEQIEASKTTVSASEASSHFLTEVDERADLLALQTSRLYSAMRQNKEAAERDRVVMTSKSLDTKDFVPLSSEDTEWEEELAKRAGMYRNKGDTGGASRGRDRDRGDLIDLTTLGGRGAHRDSSLSARSGGGGGGASDRVGSVFVDEIQQTVQKAMEALSTGIDAAERKRVQVIEAKEREKEEEKVLRAKVEQEVANMNTMQTLRVFCSEVVGMLRDKEDMIQQLKDAALIELKNKADVIRKRRIQDQEDILCKLKQTHELIDLGSYTPTATLLDLDDILREELENIHESANKKMQIKKKKEELNARVHGRVVRRWRRQGLQVPVSVEEEGEVKSVHPVDVTATAVATAATAVAAAAASTSIRDDDEKIIENGQSFSEAEKAERLAELNEYYNKPKAPKRAGLGLGLGFSASSSAVGSGGGSSSGTTPGTTPAVAFNKGVGGGLGFVSATSGIGTVGSSGSNSKPPPRQMMFVAAGGSKVATVEECIHQHSTTTATATATPASISHSLDANASDTQHVGDAVLPPPPPPQPPKLSAAFTNKFLPATSSASSSLETSSTTSATTAATTTAVPAPPAAAAVITQTDIDNESTLISRDAALESDNDLSDDERGDHRKRQRIVEQAAKVLMDDVRPEISSVSEILKQMSEFRSKLPKFYKASFISLSLPGIVEPLVLLDFIPLRLFDADSQSSNHNQEIDKGGSSSSSSNQEIDKGGSSSSSSVSVSVADRDWHNSFVDFCTAAEDPDKMDIQGGGGGGVDDNSDDTLLPRVVCSALLPWVTSVISTYLDPLSNKACRRCVQLLQELLEYDPKPLQLAAPLKAIVTVFEGFFRTLCLPTVLSSGQLGRLFLRQQLLRAAKCLDNFSLFRGIVASKAMAQLTWQIVSSNSLKASRMALASQDEGLQTAATRLLTAALRIIQPDPKVSPQLESAAAVAQAVAIAAATTGGGGIGNHHQLLLEALKNIH